MDFYTKNFLMGFFSECVNTILGISAVDKLAINLMEVRLSLIGNSYHLSDFYS